MIVVSRFAVPEADEARFRPGAEGVLDALSGRPGFVRGRLGRAVDQDEPGTSTWALVTEWDTVGAYRRGLSWYDVKLAVAEVAPYGVPEAGAYEVLKAAEEAQLPAAGPSTRAR